MEYIGDPGENFDPLEAYRHNENYDGGDDPSFDFELKEKLNLEGNPLLSSYLRKKFPR